MTDLPPLSDKDLEDIRFGIEHDIDMVAASFVRNAAGVDAIRAHITDCHAKHAPDPSAPPPLIISKVSLSAGSGSGYGSAAFPAPWFTLGLRAGFDY